MRNTLGAQLWQVRMPRVSGAGLAGCGCGGQTVGQLPEPGQVFTLYRVLGGVMILGGLWSMGRVGAEWRPQGEQMVLPTLSIMSGGILLAREMA